MNRESERKTFLSISRHDCFAHSPDCTGVNGTLRKDLNQPWKLGAWRMQKHWKPSPSSLTVQIPAKKRVKCEKNNWKDKNATKKPGVLGTHRGGVKCCNKNAKWKKTQTVWRREAKWASGLFTWCRQLPADPEKRELPYLRRFPTVHEQAKRASPYHSARGAVRHVAVPFFLAQMLCFWTCGVRMMS